MDPGYRGPSLSELTGSGRQSTGVIEDQITIKSPAEFALIRESTKWGHLAHALLQRYTHVGATETEVSCARAKMAMLDAIGPMYQAQSPFWECVCRLRGQIGRNRPSPTPWPTTSPFVRRRPGNGARLPSGATTRSWSAPDIGPASDDQKRMFDHIRPAGFRNQCDHGPGVKCSEVDTDRASLLRRARFHALLAAPRGPWAGFATKGPFMDLGDPTELRPGMVMRVEPGLYLPGLGGFRHSDTVVVTADGVEVMTFYPRDLESLTLPV